MTYDYAVTEVIRVVDGDTVDMRLDVGFHLTAALRFRVLDLDTPERGEPGWAEATGITSSWLAVHAALPGGLRARTAKADSFGRWLADIYQPADGVRLSDYVADRMHVLYGIDARWRP